MNTKKIKDDPTLLKVDDASIISTDVGMYKKYIAERRARNKVKDQQDQIDELKEQMNSIHSLLEQINNNINND